MASTPPCTASSATPSPGGSVGSSVTLFAPASPRPILCLLVFATAHAEAVDLVKLVREIASGAKGLMRLAPDKALKQQVQETADNLIRAIDSYYRQKDVPERDIACDDIKSFVKSIKRAVLLTDFSSNPNLHAVYQALVSLNRLTKADYLASFCTKLGLSKATLMAALPPQPSACCAVS